MAIIVAGGGMAAVCVTGAILPFFFAAYHNDRLRIGLGLKVAMDYQGTDRRTRQAGIFAGLCGGDNSQRVGASPYGHLSA
jgi:hypothetical protein